MNSKDILLGIFSVVTAGALYTVVSYNKACLESKSLSLGLGYLASFINITIWTYVVQKCSKPKDIAFVNLCWDVGLIIVLLFLPWIFFQVKYESKTIIGCIIAITGIAIVKI